MESPFLTRKDRKTRTKCGTGDLFSYLYSPSVHTDTWTFIFSFVMNIGTRFEEKADHGKVVGFLYFFLFRNMQQHERKAVVRALASEQATRV